VTNVLYDFLNFFAINLKEFARKLEYFPNYQKKPSTHDYGRVEGAMSIHSRVHRIDAS